MRKIFVVKGRYVDSVTLMGIGESAMNACNISNAEAGMGTPANKDTLREIGYQIPEDFSEIKLP